MPVGEISGGIGGGGGRLMTVSGVYYMENDSVATLSEYDITLCFIVSALLLYRLI